MIPVRNLLRIAGSAALGAALLAAGNLTGAAAPKKQDAAGAPAVALIDAQGLQKVIRSQKGKVLVLNFWATWCEPCREEFPALVRFADEHARHVSLVTVSLDDPSTIDEAVKPFLSKMKAPGLAFVKGAGDPDPFINSVDPSWTGALPATFVHDADGRRVKAVHGQIDYDKLEAIVSPLLVAGG